jgi:hypothetical protein
MGIDNKDILIINGIEIKGKDKEQYGKFLKRIGETPYCCCCINLV